MARLATRPARRAHVRLRSICFFIAVAFTVTAAFAPRHALASCNSLSSSDLFLDPTTIPPGAIGAHYTEDSLNAGGSMSFSLPPSLIVGIKIRPGQMIDSTNTYVPNVDYSACLDPVSGANNATFVKAGVYIVKIIRASGPDEWHVVGVGTQALGACFMEGIPREFAVPIPPKGYVGTDVCAPAYFPVQGCEASLAALVGDVTVDAAGGPVDVVFVEHGGEGEFTVNALDKVSLSPPEAANLALFCSLKGKIRSLRLLSCSSAHGDAGEDFIEVLSARLGGIRVTGYTGRIFTWLGAGGIRHWSCGGTPVTRRSSMLLERLNTRSASMGFPLGAARIAVAPSATTSWFFYPNACADIAAGTWVERANPQADSLNTYAPGGTVPYATVDHTWGASPSSWILSPGNGLPSIDPCSPAKNLGSDLQFFGGDPATKQTIPGAWSSVVSCVFPLPAATASCVAMWDEFADMPHGAGYVSYGEYRVKRGLIWSDWRNMSGSGSARVGIPLAWNTDGYEVAEAAGSDAVQFRYTLRCIPFLATDQVNCQAVPLGIVFDNFFLKVTSGIPAPSFYIHSGSLAQSTFVDGTMAGLNCVPAVGAPCWPGIRGTGLGPPVGINDNVNSPLGDSLIVVIRSGRGLDGTAINWNLGYDKTVAAGLALVWANPAYVPGLLGAPNMPMVVYRLFDPTTKTWSPPDSSALYPDDVTPVGGALVVVDSKFRWDWPPPDKVAAGAALPGGFTIKGVGAYAGLSFLPRGTRLQYYFRAVDTNGALSYQFSSDQLAREVVDPFPLPGSALKSPDIVEFDVLPGVYAPGAAGTLLAGKTNTPVLNLDAAYTAWSFGYDAMTRALGALGVRADRYRLLQGLGEGANIGGHELTGQRIERPSNYFPNWSEYAIRDSLVTWYRILLLPTHKNGDWPSVDEQDASLIKQWWDAETGTDGGDRCIFGTGDDLFNTLLNPSPVSNAIPKTSQADLATTVFGVGTAAGAWVGSESISNPVVDDRFSAPVSGPGLAAAGSYSYALQGGCPGPERFDALTKSVAAGAVHAATYPVSGGQTDNAVVANLAERDAITDHDRNKALGQGFSLQMLRVPGTEMRNVEATAQILYKFLTSCRGRRTVTDTSTCWPCPTSVNKFGNWASASSSPEPVGSFHGAAQVDPFQTALYGPLYPIQDATKVLTAVGGEPSPPASNRLVGNYPNPFNPETIIRFTSAWSGRVDVRIFDVTGRLVQSIAKSVVHGVNEVRWNGTTTSGGSCASGVYFVRMKFPDGTESGSSLKITIVR